MAIGRHASGDCAEGADPAAKDGQTAMSAASVHADPRRSIFRWAEITRPKPMVDPRPICARLLLANEVTLGAGWMELMVGAPQRPGTGRTHCNDRSLPYKLREGPLQRQSMDCSPVFYWQRELSCASSHILINVMNRNHDDVTTQRSPAIIGLWQSRPLSGRL